MKQTIEIPEGYMIKIVPKEEVKKGRWNPKIGVPYFFINGEGNCYSLAWFGGGTDKARYKVGNCFKTEKDAKKSDIYKAFNDKYEYWHPGKPKPSDDDCDDWEFCISGEWKKELDNPILWVDTTRRRLKEI